MLKISFNFQGKYISLGVKLKFDDIVQVNILS